MDHIEECGMTEMPAAMPAPEMDRGNPVTVNVSMNASGKDNVADLLDMMKNAGLGDAEQVSAKTLAPRMDMERLRDVVDGPMKMPAPEGIEEAGDEEGKVGTMALFVTDQNGGEHEVEVEVQIKNGKPEIIGGLPGPEDNLYWDEADIEQQVIDAMKSGDIEFDEGNAYAKAVRQAKMDGKKKGDKVKGPDGDDITLEKEQKTPLGEFILSYFDRETGEFPKGETAVLTMVEKDYGRDKVGPAKQFIGRLQQVVSEYAVESESEEFSRIKKLAGL